jgi:hypothetical protein
VTAAKARRVADQLGDTERRVVETLATVPIATGQQLRRLHWPDTDTGRRLARHHLARLTKLRVIARLNRRIGGQRSGSEGYTYRLDLVGQRLSHSGMARRFRRPWTPGHPFLAHALAVTECLVVLRELERTGRLELIAFDTEPACWRAHRGPVGARQYLKPDAFVIAAVDDWELRYFVEVDQSTEHPARITKKAQVYVDYWHSGTEQREHGVFPKVLWVAPDEPRAGVLVDALSQLDPEAWPLFQVCTVDRFDQAIRHGGDNSTTETES